MLRTLCRKDLLWGRPQDENVEFKCPKDAKNIYSSNE